MSVCVCGCPRHFRPCHGTSSFSRGTSRKSDAVPSQTADVPSPFRVRPFSQRLARRSLARSAGFKHLLAHRRDSTSDRRSSTQGAMILVFNPSVDVHAKQPPRRSSSSSGIGGRTTGLAPLLIPWRQYQKLSAASALPQPVPPNSSGDSHCGNMDTPSLSGLGLSSSFHRSSIISMRLAAAGEQVPGLVADFGKVGVEGEPAVPSGAVPLLVVDDLRRPQRRPWRSATRRLQACLR